MKRISVPELLDEDFGTQDEVLASLADLRRINRWFGGVSTMVTLVQKAIHGNSSQQCSLLDVAAASGDVAYGVAQRLPDARLSVTLLDRLPSHLAAGNQFPSVAAEALSLPFRDSSFDLVSSSLFVHHLEPAELETFLREALRVARVAVLVNDLRRSWPHYISVSAALPLFRSRLTRHDSLASVRRSHTPSELKQIALASGPARIEVHKSYLFRMGAVLWKQH